MKKILFVFMFVLMVVFPLLVLAEEATTMGDVFKSIFEDYVTPILGTALALLFVLLVKKVLAKFGVALSKEQEEYIMNVAERLVRSAEEAAAKAVKDGGDKLTGTEKLASVIMKLKAQFPALTDEKAKEIALAAVSKIPGIGLTGNGTESTGAK